MSNIEIVCGPMFSGKSEELIRRLKRIQIAKKRVLAFKHASDDRYNDANISSHTGAVFKALPVKSAAEIAAYIEKEKPDVVGIDEAQFFDEKIIDVIENAAKNGVYVIAAGLDKDFRGEAFGCMAVLLAKADYVTKLDAVCMKCGKSATMSQRNINGAPAKYNDPVTLVGADDKYEARCRRCHEVGK